MINLATAVRDVLPRPASRSPHASSSRSVPPSVLSALFSSVFWPYPVVFGTLMGAGSGSGGQAIRPSACPLPHLSGTQPSRPRLPRREPCGEVRCPRQIEPPRRPPNHRRELAEQIGVRREPPHDVVTAHIGQRRDRRGPHRCLQPLHPDQYRPCHQIASMNALASSAVGLGPMLIHEVTETRPHDLHPAGQHPGLASGGAPATRTVGHPAPLQTGQPVPLAARRSRE